MLHLHFCRKMSSREENGRFSRKCACKGHKATLAREKLLRIKTLPLKVQHQLLTNGRITQRAAFICKLCLALKPPTSEDTSSKFAFLISEVIKSMKEDIKMIRSETPTPESLSSFMGKDWLESRPVVLVNILKLICGITESSSQLDYLKLCKIVELIYNCHTNHFVSPLSFMENEITFQISKSRHLVDLNHALYPSGSYTHVRNWLSDLAEKKLPVPESNLKVNIHIF